ncbi:MAG: hypothetical protein ACR2RL_05110, partial [Gammaproteobacteria bacterium]
MRILFVNNQTNPDVYRDRRREHGISRMIEVLRTGAEVSSANSLAQALNTLAGGRPFDLGIVELGCIGLDGVR